MDGLLVGDNHQSLTQAGPCLHVAAPWRIVKDIEGIVEVYSSFGSVQNQKASHTNSDIRGSLLLHKEMGSYSEITEKSKQSQVFNLSLLKQESCLK